MISPSASESDNSNAWNNRTNYGSKSGISPVNGWSHNSGDSKAAATALSNGSIKSIASASFNSSSAADNSGADALTGVSWTAAGDVGNTSTVKRWITSGGAGDTTSNNNWAKLGGNQTTNINGGRSQTISSHLVNGGSGNKVGHCSPREGGSSFSSAAPSTTQSCIVSPPASAMSKKVLVTRQVDKSRPGLNLKFQSVKHKENNGLGGSGASSNRQSNQKGSAASAKESRPAVTVNISACYNPHATSATTAAGGANNIVSEYDQPIMSPSPGVGYGNRLDNTRMMSYAAGKRDAEAYAMAVEAAELGAAAKTNELKGMLPEMGGVKTSTWNGESWSWGKSGTNPPTLAVGAAKTASNPGASSASFSDDKTRSFAPQFEDISDSEDERPPIAAAQPAGNKHLDHLSASTPAKPKMFGLTSALSQHIPSAYQTAGGVGVVGGVYRSTSLSIPGLYQVNVGGMVIGPAGDGLFHPTLISSLGSWNGGNYGGYGVVPTTNHVTRHAQPVNGLTTEGLGIVGAGNSSCHPVSVQTSDVMMGQNTTPRVVTSSTARHATTFSGVAMSPGKLATSPVSSGQLITSGDGRSSSKFSAGAGNPSRPPVHGIVSGTMNYNSGVLQGAGDGLCSRVQTAWQQQQQPQSHLATTRSLQPLSIDTSPALDCDRLYNGGMYRRADEVADGSHLPVSDLLLSSKPQASTHTFATHPRSDIPQTGGDVKKSSLSPRVAEDVSRMMISVASSVASTVTESFDSMKMRLKMTLPAGNEKLERRGTNTVTKESVEKVCVAKSSPKSENCVAVKTEASLSPGYSSDSVASALLNKTVRGEEMREEGSRPSSAKSRSSAYGSNSLDIGTLADVAMDVKLEKYDLKTTAAAAAFSPKEPKPVESRAPSVSAVENSSATTSASNTIELRGSPGPAAALLRVPPLKIIIPSKGCGGDSSVAPTSSKSASGVGSGLPYIITPCQSDGESDQMDNDVTSQPTDNNVKTGVSSMETDETMTGVESGSGKDEYLTRKRRLKHGYKVWDVPNY